MLNMNSFFRYRAIAIAVANASEPVVSAAAEIAGGSGPDRVLLLSTAALLNNTDAIG